jgi:hypothetical protein
MMERCLEEDREERERGQGGPAHSGPGGVGGVEAELGMRKVSVLFV